MTSTTARELRRLRAATLIMAVAVLASIWYVHRDVHRTVEEVQTRTALAMQETAIAKSALNEANSVALRSFSSAEIQIAGPGDQYQNQIAIASQSLAQVAEHNAAGDQASRHLQLVEGLLVAYTSLIAQADAHHRQGQATQALVVADLWYASRLLYAPDTGIQAYLDKIRDGQRWKLDDQLAGSSTTIWRILVLVVPAVVLVGLLVLTQVYFRRRFRRSINVSFVAATLLLLLVCVLPVLGVMAQSRLETGAADLRQVVDTWETRTSVAAADGQATLRNLINAECPTACTGILDELAVLPAPVAARPDDRTMTAQGFRVDEQIKKASAHSDLEPLIPVGMLLAGALVALGFRARIEEYRYRAK